MLFRKDASSTLIMYALLERSWDTTRMLTVVHFFVIQYTPLHCSALYNASPEAIFILLSSPFAKQAFGMLDGENATPFHLACASDSVGESTEVVEMLGTKDGGVLQDRLGRTPLHIAAENPRSTKAIIKVLADINPKAAKIYPSFICSFDERFSLKNCRFRGGYDTTARKVALNEMDIPFFYTV